MLQSVEQRIEHVINNLLPTTALEGKFDSPKTLDEQLTRYHTPGISIAVINDFEIEWARGFGVCEAGTTHEVTPDTLFQAGSISKPVFALAVMRLVQEGRLNLDEDVNSYLTSWRVPANGDWQPCVTLRQLLSHTAGTTAQSYYGYHVSSPLPTTLQVLNGELPANSEKVEVNIIPGLNYRYSGGGMTIAQQVLVDVLGKPFPEIMCELVLEPLGMTNSTYQQPIPIDWAMRTATAHPINGTPLGGKHFIYPEMAAAGLWTTPTDLAKLGIELMQVLHGKSPVVWNKETIEEILRPQTEQSKGSNGSFLGLGFAGKGTGDGSYFYHGGANIGFEALMRFYARIGTGVVIMFNSNEGRPLIEEIMCSIGQAYDLPDALPQERKPIALLQTDNYSGVYATEAGLQLNVISQNGNLFLQSGQQPPLQFFPTSELEFFAKAANTNISFERDDAGNISVMTLSQAEVMGLGPQPDKQIRAKRQK
ncbi:serine hydrolase [Leptolyngbya sp. FACHB-261]|uniref:serine hydrolase n=1 Tax=Leptolyngbya sp. FACHB-261 TaxID=2692806 RepID=UPI00168937BC|nr:serine hydrolase [Leptolyngbya sp. FACHB-261]MBD2100173.1 serine hydrolase [Leptolyngbya sp. FACHB-261]